MYQCTGHKSTSKDKKILGRLYYKGIEAKKMSSLPFVSVITPVYNGEKTIAKCIESLLNQDYPKDKYEVIVVDNGSTDNASTVIKEFVHKSTSAQEHQRKICYIHEPVRGSYKARNTGIKQASGEMLAFMDADCIADKYWLKNGVEGFSDDNVGCVAGTIKSCDPANYVEEYLSEREILSQQEKTDNMPLSYAKTANAFYRRDVFERIGLFEEKWVSGGDADLSWRMQLETDCKIKFITNALVLHKHRSSLKAMFRQCVKWGVGYSLLSRKYRDRMPKRTFKQNIWIFLRFLSIPLRLLPFYFSDKDKIAKERRKKYLDYIAFVGWEIGKITGLVHKV